MEDVRRMLRPRREDAHKGDFGHALLVCGSRGMAGAAVLAAMGALRSGCGLVTVHLPESERTVIHCTCPSAMVDCDPQGHFSALPSNMERYTAVGCGCGLGRHPETEAALRSLLRTWQRPMVLDADALNIIAAGPDLLGLVPEGSILTPHLGELHRLVGEWVSAEERLAKAADLAVRTHSCVVVKGPHSAVISPGQRGCADRPAYRVAGLWLRGVRGGPPGSVAARQGGGHRRLPLWAERHEQPRHRRLSRRSFPLC